MLRWQITAALARLSPAHREVIRLAHYGGLTMREIAERTGIPLGTVKSRTSYALRSLRLILDEMEVEPSPAAAATATWSAPTSSVLSSPPRSRR